MPSWCAVPTFSATLASAAPATAELTRLGSVGLARRQRQCGRLSSSDACIGDGFGQSRRCERAAPSARCSHSALRVTCRASGGDGDGERGARRITDTSRMGLKTQLKLVKLKKELVSAPKEKVVVRTKHRKKKQTVEEREVQRAQTARAEAEAKKMGEVSFRSLFGSDGLANPPVLLVDGYNVIFEARKWTGQSGARLDADLMDQYRRDLTLNLECFSHARGVKIMVVFDALNGAARRTTVTETSKTGLDVVWSGEMDADTFISCKVSELYEQGLPYVFVASNDGTLQTTCRCNNAYIITGRRLIREMREVDRETKEAMREVERDTLRRGVGQLRNSLPNSTFAKLEEMRQGGRKTYKHANSSDGDSGPAIDEYLRSLRAKQSRWR